MLLVILFAVGASSMKLHPMNETSQINESDLESVPVITAMTDYIKDMLDEINVIHEETLKQGCQQSKSFMQEEDPGHYMASPRMLCDRDLRSMYYNCKSLCSALATFAGRLSCESQNWFTYMTQCGSGHRSMTCPGAVITETTIPTNPAPTNPAPTNPAPTNPAPTNPAAINTAATTELQMEGNSLANTLNSLESAAIRLVGIADELIEALTSPNGNAASQTAIIVRLQGKADRVQRNVDGLGRDVSRSVSRARTAAMAFGLSATVRAGRRANNFVLAARSVELAAESLRFAADEFSRPVPPLLPNAESYKRGAVNAQTEIVRARLPLQIAIETLSI